MFSNFKVFKVQYVQLYFFIASKIYHTKKCIDFIFICFSIEHNIIEERPIPKSRKLLY